MICLLASQQKTRKARLNAGYCLVLGAGIEPAHLAARDFKSLVSTYFTIRAMGANINSLSPILLVLLYKKAQLCWAFKLEAEAGIEPA
jgi:hypothetical protein